MQAIPRFALIHGCIYYKRTGVNEYGEAQYEQTGTDDDDNPLYGLSVMYVRCEPIKESAMRSLGEMKDDKLRLFYDFRNSSPTTLTISPLDKIVFNGVDYIVRQVLDFSPHHIEVTLK